MRRIAVGVGPAALLSAIWLPGPAYASAGPAKDPPAAGEEDDMIILEDEMEGETPAGEEGGPSGEAAGDLDNLLGGEDAKEAEANAKDAAKKPGEEDPKEAAKSERDQIKTETKLIRVVQRQRMLKKKRIGLQPQIGISINDPYVRQYTFGAEISYWITNRMALSLLGNGQVASRTPRYDNIKIQEGLLLTANKILWQGGLAFSYNPFYGKIAIFNRFLLHWEAFAQVGGGAMQTEVIPRFEALHEPFRNFTGGGQFTIGTRFYMPKINWLSVNVGIRTWVFPDKLEPPQRGFDTDAGDRLELDPPDAARDAASWQVQFNSTLYLGFSFYLPSDFEYTTPR